VARLLVFAAPPCFLPRCARSADSPSATHSVFGTPPFRFRKLIPKVSTTREAGPRGLGSPVSGADEEMKEGEVDDREWDIPKRPAVDCK